MNCTKLLTALCLGATLCVAAEAQDRPTPLELLERHLEATGGKNNHAGIVGMKRTWEVTANGGKSTLTTSWTPKAHRSVLADNAGTWQMAWGEDTDGPWQSGLEGGYLVPDRAESLVLRMQADPAPLLRHGDYFRRLATANHVQLDTGPAWRVLAAPKAGKVVTFFFDETTGRLVEAEYYRADATGKQRQVRAVYGDWKQFGPVTLPYSMVESAGKERVELKLKGLEVLPVPAEALARVEGATQPGATPGTTGPVKADHHRTLRGLVGDTVTLADGSTVSSEELASRENVLLYFTAKWCPPCKAFTPKLVNYAKQDSRDDWVIIMVSSDRSRGDMLEYMQQYNMHFPAVNFDKADGVKGKFAGGGIPNLVWLGPDDKVVKGSYETDGKYTPQTRGSYIGPQAVLDAFAKR